VVRGLHLVYAGKDHPVSYQIVGNVRTVLNGRVVPYVAGDYRAVPYSRGNAKIVMFEQYIRQDSQAYKPVKPGIADKGRLKGIAYQKIIPVGTVIVVLYENFYLPGFEPPPGRRGTIRLAVPQPVFVLTGGQKLRGDKIVSVPFGTQNRYIVHHELPYPPVFV
jgi:hypothetical protein